MSDERRYCCALCNQTAPAYKTVCLSCLNSLETTTKELHDKIDDLAEKCNLKDIRIQELEAMLYHHYEEA